MRELLVLFLLTVISQNIACNAGQDPSSAAESITNPAVETAVAHRRAVALASTRGPGTLGEPLADTAGAHLAISLRRQNEAAHEALLADLQDPASPRFHAWLTPEEYGERFGLPAATYGRVVAWLEAAGFAVKTYPNRLFVDAAGTVAQVRTLVGVQLRAATLNGKSFHSHAEDIVLPEDIAPLVLRVGGLDTRAHYHRHLRVQEPEPTGDGGTQERSVLALGADDLRTLYDLPSSDTGAGGLTLAVLGWQAATFPPHATFVPPDEAAIAYYLANVSHATATYNPVVLPNADDAFGTVGDNAEWELDVEMQSVGAPNAKEIDLVLAPQSLLAQTGAQHIVNELSEAVVVSTSFGGCEHIFLGEDGGVDNPASDAYLFRMAVQQGLAEGQTWFAASGDTGAADCDGEGGGPADAGFHGGSATVDLPCSIPEVVCVGGTMFNGPGTWSDAGALSGYVQEATWHEGSDPNNGGGAGGGGQSALFPKPAYQTGVGPDESDGTRDVPDIALMAAGTAPGVVFDDGAYGYPFDGGPSTLSVISGTSVAAPLAAGIFAHLSGDVGCRLGDVHGTLYALGAAQQAHPGPGAPFHDVTIGNNDFEDFQGNVITGFGAKPGYDLATGWGSVDLAKLAAEWPGCRDADGGAPGDAGHEDASSDDGGGDRDAGRRDAGHSDAGPADAAHEKPDTGISAHDAGHDALVATRDAGPVRDAAKLADAREDAAAGVSSSGGCSAGGAAPSCDWAVWLLGTFLMAARRKRCSNVQREDRRSPACFSSS